MTDQGEQEKMTDPNPSVSISGGRLLTINEAANLLHVSRSTVYRMVNNGILASVGKPAYSTGSESIRIPKSAVTAYLTQLRHGAGVA